MAVEGIFGVVVFMHESVPPVPIPPPRAVAFFKMKLANSPGWGHCELANAPPAGSYKN